MKKLFITIALLLCLTLNLVPFGIVNAEERVVDYDKSSVVDDLQDYNIVNSDTSRVITVMEYCFAPTKPECSNFGLYVYVQNPSKKRLSVNVGANVVNMAISYSNYEPNGYDNLDLKLINHSSDFSLYKFKVVESLDTILDNSLSLNSTYGKRRYDIASIQLHYEEENTYFDFLVGGTYVFGGYANGVTDINQPLSFEQFDTIELNVKDTYYRTPSSDKGKNYQNQITSVYFSVPNEYLERYESLTEVTCNWYEYKTPYIAVLANQNKYYNLLPYVGVDIGQHTDDLNVDLRSQDFDFMQIGTIGGRTWYDWTYNMPYYENYWANVYSGSDVYCNVLYYLFSTKGQEAATFKLSSEELKSYINNYSKSNSNYEIVGARSYPKELLSGVVEDYRTRGFNRKVIKNTDLQPVLSYNENHGFWETADDFGFWNALFGSNVPKDESFVYDLLHEVKPSEVLSTTISDDLLIDSSDVVEFQDYVNSATIEDKTTFLLRFAKTDYLAFNLSNGDGYIAQESLFLNFDIIQLKFGLGKNSKIVPVCSNPIDIIPPVTPPVDYNESSDLTWLVFSIIVIGGSIIGILARSIIKE